MQANVHHLKDRVAVQVMQMLIHCLRHPQIVNHCHRKGNQFFIKLKISSGLTSRSSMFRDVYSKHWFPRYRVVLFGDAGTGKTALVSQFMTSEYMHTYDASLGKFFNSKKGSSFYIAFWFISYQNKKLDSFSHSFYLCVCVCVRFFFPQQKHCTSWILGECQETEFAVCIAFKIHFSPLFFVKNIYAVYKCFFVCPMQVNSRYTNCFFILHFLSICYRFYSHKLIFNILTFSRKEATNWLEIE